MHFYTTFSHVSGYIFVVFLKDDFFHSLHRTSPLKKRHDRKTWQNARSNGREGSAAHSQSLITPARVGALANAPARGMRGAAGGGDGRTNRKAKAKTL